LEPADGQAVALLSQAERNAMAAKGSGLIETVKKVVMSVTGGSKSPKNAPREEARRQGEVPRRQPARASAPAEERTKADLMREARERNIPGRSKMSKDELTRALGA
jgi:hypothetical protein